MLPQLANLDELQNRLPSQDHIIYKGDEYITGLARLRNDLPMLIDGVPIMELCNRVINITLPELIFLEQLGLRRDWNNRLEFDWTALENAGDWLEAIFDYGTQTDNTYAYWRISQTLPIFDSFSKLVIIEQGRHHLRDIGMGHPNSIMVAVTCDPEILELVEALISSSKPRVGNIERFLRLDK